MKQGNEITKYIGRYTVTYAHEGQNIIYVYMTLKTVSNFNLG